MSDFNKTILIRHRKENLKKCSLRGLEGHEDCQFYIYPLKCPLPDLSNYLLLTMGGEPLSKKDATKPLLLIDGTWKYAAKMEKNLPLPPDLCKRSLPPGLVTAYPRRQEDCPSPETGLASIEALYAAIFLLGGQYANLLDQYLWKEEFLRKNAEWFSKHEDLSFA